MENILKPYGNRLIVKEDPPKEASQIIITTDAKERPTTGYIVAVSGSYPANTEFKIGDRVLYSRYSGTEIKFKKDKIIYKIISIEEVLCWIISDEELELHAF